MPARTATMNINRETANDESKTEEQKRPWKMFTAETNIEREQKEKTN